MFSVIIPAYNAELFILGAIESVLGQTEEDFELIVVDDGSTDATDSVVWSVKDDRIRYIRQENGGVSLARNTGIRAATGEYICFLDADDCWKENHLAVLKKLINKYPDCAVFITGHEVLLNNGTVVPNSENRLKNIKDEDFSTDNIFDEILKYGYFFHTNSMCCVRELFKKVGTFAVGVKNGEDDDMWYRLFLSSSVAVSKVTTTCYSRLNCGATATRVRVLDWVFLGRVDEINQNPSIPEERKASLRTLLERRRLSDVRYLILTGRKKEAFQIFRTLHYREHKPKRVLVTAAAFLVPYKITKFFIDNRDKEYY